MMTLITDTTTVEEAERAFVEAVDYLRAQYTRPMDVAWPMGVACLEQMVTAHRHIDASDEYMNRAIRRVVDLRRAGELTACARIVAGRPLRRSSHIHFVCAIERADGTLETPEGEFIDPAGLVAQEKQQ